MNTIANKRKRADRDDSSSEDEAPRGARTNIPRPAGLIPPGTGDNDDEDPRASVAHAHTIHFAGEVFVQGAVAAEQTARAVINSQGVGEGTTAPQAWNLAVFVNGNHGKPPLGAGVAIGFVPLSSAAAMAGKAVFQTWKIAESQVLNDLSTQGLAILEGLRVARDQLVSAVETGVYPPGSDGNVATVKIFTKEMRLVKMFRAGQHAVADTKFFAVVVRILKEIQMVSRVLVEDMSTVGVKLVLQLHWTPIVTGTIVKRVVDMSRNVQLGMSMGGGSSKKVVVKSVYDVKSDFHKEIRSLWGASNLPEDVNAPVTGAVRSMKRMRLANPNTETETDPDVGMADA